MHSNCFIHIYSNVNYVLIFIIIFNIFIRYVFLIDINWYTYAMKKKKNEKLTLYLFYLLEIFIVWNTDN